MLTMLHALESPVVEALGWALVHFVWQAALLGGLLAVLLLPLRRASARVRYLVQCAVLVAMAACPLATWWWIGASAKPGDVEVVSSDDRGPVEEEPLLADEPVLGPMVSIGRAFDTIPDSRSMLVAPAPVVEDRDSRFASPPSDQIETPAPEADSSWTGPLHRRLTPALPWVVSAWLLGVVVLSLRLLVGWRIVQQLKRLAVTPAAEAWQAKLKELAARLRISRPVRLVESAMIEVPTVIGWLRPVILLPASVLTSLTPQQLEAVLAHELAHIRRHDYLVNLIQTAIETLLFYHPAVWWVSNLIRAEREHCCDDLALRLCDNAVTYVTALAAMEELRASPSLTIAATGGSLLGRIRRIAIGPDNVPRRSIWWGASLIAFAALFALGLTTYVASRTNEPANQSPAASDDAAKAGANNAADTTAAEPEDSVETPPTASLEFLKPYPKLSGLSLVMTEPQFLEIVKQQELKTRKTVDGEKVTHHIALGDDHTLIVMFDKDAKCSGIQRVRGEDAVVEAPAEKPADSGVQALPPLLEFRFVAQAADSKFEPRVPADYEKRDYSGNSVIGRVVARDKGFIWVPVAESKDKIAALPVERLRGGQVREALLADTPEHALPFNGKWSIEDCRVVPDPNNAERFIITLKLNEAGGAALRALSKTHLNQPLAILVNNEIISAPIVREEFGQNIAITGNFTREQADALQKSLVAQVQIPAGDERSEVSPNGEVVGQLVDELGQPRAGYTVVCAAVINDSGKGGGGKVVTDDEGRYRIKVPSPGIYSVFLRHLATEPPEMMRMTAIADDGLVVEAGKLTSSRLVLMAGTPIGGLLVDEQDQPVPNETVYCYSLAKPMSTAEVMTAKSDEKGNFTFWLPPGRAYFYAFKSLPKSADNVDGERLDVHLVTSVPRNGELPVPAPLKLVLAKSKPKPIGDPWWTVRSTPGTQVLRQEDAKDVTGTVVDISGEPIPGAKVFRYDGPLVAANEKGEFTVTASRGTQFQMHAFQPGYRVWSGIPAAGDVLKIVLEEKNAAIGVSKTQAQLPSSDKEQLAKELASFQGTWCFDVLQFRVWPEPIGIGTDSNGRKSEKRMVVKGNQIAWTDRTGELNVVSFTIDPFQTPKQIDFTFIQGPHRGQKSIGIYEPQLGNDDYRWLCMTNPGTDAPRPTDVSYSSLKQQSMIGMYQVAPPARPSAAKALERFQGEWRMELCDSTLRTYGADQQEASKWQWTIKGDEILWSRQGDVWKLKLEIDPSKRPREMDITYLSGPFQGEKCLGMYEFGGIDEQSLMIAIQDPGSKAPRPTQIAMSSSVKTGLIFLRPSKPSDAERQIAAFQGTWTLRNFDTGKNNDKSSWPLPQGKGPDKSGAGSELRWVAKGNEITWTSRDDQEIKASFTIDPTKRPKQIDLTFLSGPNKGETCPGIYQRGDLDENILWLCLADPGSKAARPKEFSYQFGAGRSVLSLYLFEPSKADPKPKPGGPAAADDANAAIDPNGEIVGRLVDAATGKPVAGATIACKAVINDSGKGGGASSITDAEGRYRLAAPTPGIYFVWLKQYDQDPSMTAADDDGVLVEAGKVSKSQLHLVKGRNVTGKVVDQDGMPFGNLSVNCYSSARPHLAVETAKTRDDGSFAFVFALPPGQVRVYCIETVEKSKDNPLGFGRVAEAFVDVSESAEPAPITLTLRNNKSESGEALWLKRSTTGTEIVRHEDADDVTGTVVDVSGKPIPGAKVFRHDGRIVTTDDTGEFKVNVDKGTQFVMHAFAPGYHVWFGTPTAGDVLKIVLEKKDAGNPAVGAAPPGNAQTPREPAAELARQIQSRVRELSDGRMELAMKFEWPRPTPDNPDHKITTTGTVRWLKSGKLIRLEYDREIPDPNPQSTRLWEEHWTTGFDGDMFYAWDRLSKTIRFGELRSDASYYSPQSLFWGQLPQAFEHAQPKSWPQVKRTQRDGREVWDVSSKDPNFTNFGEEFLGLAPERGFLPVQIERTRDALPVWRCELKDFFELKPGVWGAKTLLTTDIPKNIKGKRGGYHAARTEMTITRLELGSDARLKEEDFALRLPGDVKTRQWEDNAALALPPNVRTGLLRFVGGEKQEPLAGLQVEITHGYSDKLKHFGTFTTDDSGTIKVSLPIAFYYLHLKSDKELPYLPVEVLSKGEARGPKIDLNLNVTPNGVEKWLNGEKRVEGYEPPAAPTDLPRITYTLLPACELTLRAVDAETGKGLPGVEFYEENAVGEDWAHAIDGRNIGWKLVAAANHTDQDGNFRRLVSANAGFKYGVEKTPAGYKVIDGREVEIDIRYGQLRAEHTFKFRRIRAEVRVEPDAATKHGTFRGVVTLVGDRPKLPPQPGEPDGQAKSPAENGPADLLGQMIEQPSLELLRQLLASAKIEHPRPVELLDPGRTWPVNGINWPDDKRSSSKVRLIPNGAEKFAVVEARVRPVTGGDGIAPDDHQRLPECAFVFDMQGKLLAAIGGKIGTTNPRSPSPERVHVLCLGPAEDWFVSVSRFEDRKPFNYQSTYYRIADPVVTSLKFSHHSNSLGRSNGPEKTTRLGALYFYFSKEEDEVAHYATGTTPDDVAVLPIIYWDGDRNRFVGPAKQQADNKPLYQVDAEWSRDFEPFDPKPDQLVVSGGARDYSHWYLWQTVVPEHFEAIVVLKIPQREGPPQRVERKLGPGRHKIQIQAEPRDDALTASLKLWVDKDDKQDLELPHQLDDRPAAHPPIVQVLNPGESKQLVNRPLKTSPQPFVAEIKFQPLGTGDIGEQKENAPGAAPGLNEDAKQKEGASKKAEAVLKQAKSGVLFEDNFNNGLSDKWQVVGLQKEDYRIRDGGLEMRVQPGKRTRDTPMLKVILPFATTSTVIASVDVTILDEFTEDGEFGGLCLIADDDVEFTVKKLRVNGSLVFAPGKYDFVGKPGDEGEPRNYTIKYWPALDESGPLRIIVRQKYAHFQVGPSSEDKFLNFFFSAIADSDKKCGFSLVAAGAPKDAVHWVRFDNFRVTR